MSRQAKASLTALAPGAGPGPAVRAEQALPVRQSTTSPSREHNAVVGLLGALSPETLSRISHRPPRGITVDWKRGQFQVEANARFIDLRNALRREELALALTGHWRLTDGVFSCPDVSNASDETIRNALTELFLDHVTPAIFVPISGAVPAAEAPPSDETRPEVGEATPTANEEEERPALSVEDALVHLSLRSLDRLCNLHGLSGGRTKSSKRGVLVEHYEGDTRSLLHHLKRPDLVAILTAPGWKRGGVEYRVRGLYRLRRDDLVGMAVELFTAERMPAAFRPVATR